MEYKQTSISKKAMLVAYIALFTVVLCIPAYLGYRDGDSLELALKNGFKFQPLSIFIIYIVFDRTIYGDLPRRKRNFLLLGLVAYTTIIWALGNLAYQLIGEYQGLLAVYIVLYLFNILGYSFVRRYNNFGVTKN